MESDFRFDVTVSRWRPSERANAAAFRQFLIYSTLVLVN